MPLSMIHRVVEIFSDFAILFISKLPLGTHLPYSLLLHQFRSLCFLRCFLPQHVTFLLFTTMPWYSKGIFYDSSLLETFALNISFMPNHFTETWTLLEHYHFPLHFPCNYILFFLLSVPCPRVI